MHWKFYARVRVHFKIEAIFAYPGLCLVFYESIDDLSARLPNGHGIVVHVGVCMWGCPGLWSSPGENCGLWSSVFLDCFGSPGEDSGLSS